MFGATHPVMAVGDPNQAIYGFRGASADALRQFVNRFGGDTVARHTLSVSWRNEASILTAANATVAPLAAGPVMGVPLRSRGEARRTGTLRRVAGDGRGALPSPRPVRRDHRRMCGRRTRLRGGGPRRATGCARRGRSARLASGGPRSVAR